MNNCQEHEYVDLGLPSGTLWATCNVGAKKSEDCGDYFAWGEAETKPIYDNDEYHFLDYWTRSLKKYNEKDGLLSLQSEDDVAYLNWGVSWRMPSVDDFLELINNCRHSWIERNGKEGSLYVAQNNNSIFFPAGGYKFLGKFAEDQCFYWTRTMKREDVFSAMILFNSKDGQKLARWNENWDSLYAQYVWLNDGTVTI